MSGGCVPRIAVASLPEWGERFERSAMLEVVVYQGVACKWSGGGRFQIRFSVVHAVGGTHLVAELRTDDTPHVNFHVSTLPALQHAFIYRMATARRVRARM